MKWNVELTMVLDHYYTMTTTCNYLLLNITLTIIIANECDAYQRLLSYLKLSCLEIEKQYHVSITQFDLF